MRQTVPRALVLLVCALAALPGGTGEDPAGSTRAQALGLQKHALQARAEERLASALEGLRKACAIFEELGDARQTAWCAMAIAGVEGEMRPSADALRTLEATREGLLRVGDARSLCALEKNLAAVSREQGELASARAFSERGVRCAQALGDRFEEAEQLHVLGRVLSVQDDLAHAAETEKQAAALAAEIGDARTEALARFVLGKLERELGDTPAAVLELRRGVTAARRAGGGKIEGDCAAVLALVLHEQGQIAQAGVWLDRAQALAAVSDSVALRCQVATLRATWLVARGKASQALPILDAPIRELEASGDASRLATTLECRATALFILGRYEEAISVQRAAIGAALRSGETQCEAWRRSLLGAFLGVMGDFPDAQRELETAVRLHDQGGNEMGRCAALGRLGFVRGRAGDRAGALRDLESSLQCATKSGQIVDRGSALTDLARLELESGPAGASAALERLADAAELGRKSNDTHMETDAELLTAHAQLLLGNVGAAKAALARIAPLGREKRNPYNEWSYQYLCARVASLEGQRRQAVRLCERAVREVEQLRSGVQRPVWKATLLDDRIEPYRELTMLYLEAGDVESAYRVAGLGKARDFVEKLLPAPGTGQESLEISGWETTVAPVSRLRSLLGEREALLDFFILRDRVVVFVLKREGLRARILTEDPVTLQQLAGAARFPGRPGPSEAAVTEAWRRATERLGSALLDPLAADLSGVQDLLVAPNGALHSVPFAALPFEGAPLVEKRNVAVLPAAEALFSRRAPRAAVRGLLVLGDPEIDRRGSRLPGAALEIGRVASLAGTPAWSGSGSDASEAAYRAHASASEYIHLAAHGRVDRIAPLHSRIELAGGGGEDGSLTAKEVAASKIGASLVVLSGCETAQETGIATEDAPGDEREGLVRAFLKAGAGTVVASLWEQSDSDSPAIFPEIYRALARGLAPGAALNRVQREMLHGALRGSRGASFDHPFYWAGIVAYGAGR